MLESRECKRYFFTIYINIVILYFSLELSSCSVVCLCLQETQDLSIFSLYVCVCIVYVFRFKS